MDLQSKRFIYINSAQRASGTSSNFVIPITLPASEKYTHVTLLQASVPVSYYLINENANTFVLFEDGSLVTITIPVGNYNINSFTKIVSQILNIASPHHCTYTATYPKDYTDNNIGKITWSVVGNSIQPAFIMSNDPRNYLYMQFGFVQGSSNVFIGNSLKSTNVVNFVVESTLFLHSNLVSDGTDILQAFFSTSDKALTNVVWLNPDPITYSKKINDNASQSISFSLTDENGGLINLNGQEMVFTLLFYRQSNLLDLIKGYIQYSISGDTTTASAPTQ
jgi:hypothetical protein